MEGIFTIPIHEAKSSLSKLIKRVAAGETIYIGAYGKPEAALVPVTPGQQQAELRKKAFGCMKDKMMFYKGWEEPLPDKIVDDFYRMRGLEDFKKK